MDEAKFDALVHFICARCDDPSRLGATKLNKVLWYCDTGAFLFFGRPITGATYIKRQFGPVPKDILAAKDRLIARGALVEREMLFHGYLQKQLVALTPPDPSRFSSDEIDLIDQVIKAICDGHTASSISELTHDHVWEAAEIGEELPLYTVFAHRRGEIDETDVAWARAEIARAESERVVA